MTRSARKLRHLLAPFTLLISSAAAGASEGQVALTFDDLPGLSITVDQKYVDHLNRLTTQYLAKHRVPAIGFVNEGKLTELEPAHQIANLKRWLRAGLQLGNHTYSHASLNEVGPRSYIEDIVKGERITKALLSARGEQMRYFRAPYLETGKTLRDKQEVQSWLTAHGYWMAPVTIDADDWEFAEPYDDAIRRKDAAGQRRIRAEYLDLTAARIGWAQESARRLFGRDIRHIMLLHCTRLNADTLPAVVKLLARAHLKPVTIDEALQDPVYQQPDLHLGDGIDWLQRWADVRQVDLPEAGDEDPPADIQAAYDRVDHDRQQ